MKRLYLASTILLFGFLNGGCSDDTLPEHPTEWNDLLPTDHGEVSVYPQEEVFGKRARRISVDHLRQSIPALFGGISWTNPNGSQNQFDKLSQTLGEADYLNITLENREPSPLFAKFMDDMAGNVCEKALAQDTAGESWHIMVYPDDVGANLRFLRLKFHGIYVPDDSNESLADLKALYEDILSLTNQPAQAWHGVCIALLTAPEFLAY
jgi:hypothetical protein